MKKLHHTIMVIDTALAPFKANSWFQLAKQHAIKVFEKRISKFLEMVSNLKTRYNNEGRKVSDNAVRRRVFRRELSPLGKKYAEVVQAIRAKKGNWPEAISVLDFDTALGKWSEFARVAQESQ